LSGRGLCDELITSPEESYRLCCVVVCDLETSRMGAPYIYDISSLRVRRIQRQTETGCSHCLRWVENFNICPNELKKRQQIRVFGLCPMAVKMGFVLNKMTLCLILIRVVRFLAYSSTIQ